MVLRLNNIWNNVSSRFRQRHSIWRVAGSYRNLASSTHATHIVVHTAVIHTAVVHTAVVHGARCLSRHVHRHGVVHVAHGGGRHVDVHLGEYWLRVWLGEGIVRPGVFVGSRLKRGRQEQTSQNLYQQRAVKPWLCARRGAEFYSNKVHGP